MAHINILGHIYFHLSLAHAKGTLFSVFLMFFLKLLNVAFEVPALDINEWFLMILKLWGLLRTDEKLRIPSSGHCPDPKLFWSLCVAKHDYGP